MIYLYLNSKSIKFNYIVKRYQIKLRLMLTSPENMFITRLWSPNILTVSLSTFIISFGNVSIFRPKILTGCLKTFLEYKSISTINMEFEIFTTI